MKLPPESLKWCTRQATTMVKIWNERQQYGKRYNHNRVDSNVVGIRGEVAAYNYLKLAGPVNLQVEPNFMQIENEKLKGDILVKGLKSTAIGIQSFSCFVTAKNEAGQK